MRRCVPLALGLMLGCNKASAPGWHSFDDTVQTREGVARVEIEIPKGTRSFMLTAWSEYLTAVEAIRDPNGDVVVLWDDWYYETETLTSAFFAEYPDVVLNWPVRAEDGELEPGLWTVDVGVVDRSNSYVDVEPVDIKVHTAIDDDLGQGVIQAQIVYADGVDEAHVRSAVERAAEQWQSIYASVGLTLELSWGESDLDAMLPEPGDEPGAFDSLNKQRPEGSLTLVVGEMIGAEDDTLGIAGSIPGTLAASDRSVVMIAWVPNAGPDLRFDDEDVRLLAETMAHEAGHYLGLFHPVEWDYDYWDALSDTPHCASQAPCEEQLGANLMFAYPICGDTDCVPQTGLTPQQVGVAQRWVGTL